MAGQSSRFFRSGYLLPKYMLEIPGGSVFAWALKSFASYFQGEHFLFITREDGFESAAFIRRECEALGISHFEVCVLDGVTSGQAQTVLHGLERTKANCDNPLTIFNIDTFRRSIEPPADFDPALDAGFVEVFEGSGENWSYVLPAVGLRQIVGQTAEKTQISNLCCTGLYHFSTVAIFRTAYEFRCQSGTESAEIFVAPLYNSLIGRGCTILYQIVKREDVVFCGVPAEFECLRETGKAPFEEK